MNAVLLITLSAGRLLAQSSDSGATYLLKDFDASQVGVCSKVQAVRAGDRKLSGLMLEITYQGTYRRTLAAYQDSTGNVAEYVEVLTSPEGQHVLLHTIAARFLHDGQVRGLALTTVLSPSAPNATGLGARPRASRPLTSEEQERVRSLSRKVLHRCTNAS